MKHSVDITRIIKCGSWDVHWLSANVLIDETLALGQLHADDAAYAATIKAVTRKSEFIRSRWLMSEFGWLPKEHPTRSADGVPRFANNIPGSISHKSGQVVCVSAASTNWSSIGVDLEDIGKVHRGLANKICTAKELKYLDSYYSHQPEIWLRCLCVIFSFKEALFKAHFPLGKKMFYFHDAEVESLSGTLLNRGEIAGKILIDTSPKTLAGSVVNGDFVTVDENGSTSQDGKFCLTVVGVKSN